ncbi:PREDICTED: lanosterol 14-alpha demethylase-like [Amphimedon queenslandica]|uniref:Lanosterol 14-alpha demethylase n=1 Tax=Amphimedon queenslandica TaxID=400682 RepID=A0A1X7VRN7_AMPQE|nr:PREDICTED: lanosterol 14-alpha demethylase-like [Amphimedon queenslandica]|eukprot:XP_011407086.2 PREDICTED: lanosterol 14-alpha demethylase-like [Amphimedon queenslandica]
METTRECSNLIGRMTHHTVWVDLLQSLISLCSVCCRNTAEGRMESSFSNIVSSVGPVAVLILTVLLVHYWWRRAGNKVKGNPPPPLIPSSLPFIGAAVSFGKDPINYLLAAHSKYGNVFSFNMVGSTFTYLIGSDSTSLFFNSRNESLNAEEVYSRLVTPVFGKGVAYDVPHDLFVEQKKMLKYGLSVSHFRRYVPLIETETTKYFERWGDKGERDIFKALSELIILTASRCLHGPEIRSVLNEEVAQLYTDLDGGFTHAAWLLPSWLPLPSFKKRDKARERMAEIFTSVIKKRREMPNNQEDDILSYLITTTYKDGRSLTDSEITGLLIGLLMAGQHTSSSTSSWLGFFLARHSDYQTRAYEEQLEVCGSNCPPLDYDQLKDLTFLDCCLKETLRLRPPIMTMMRMAKTEQDVGGYTIPAGHQVCVSPTVNHQLNENWTDPQTFNPDRFVDEELSNSEKFSYVPFGAGRHRCIGESFAYVQIKTIWSVLLRKYQFELVGGVFPPVNYQTMIHTPTQPVIAYKLRQ